MHHARVAMSVAAVMICLPMLASQALAFCATRHAYNKSSYTTTITLDNHATCSIGNVNKADTCVIPPGGAADLHWPNYPTQTAPLITIKNEQTDVRYRTDASYCYLAHQGGTGNVVLNDPADGDVAILNK